MDVTLNSQNRDNLLRVVKFERPDYIPMTFHINPACWHHYPREALLELQAEHSFLFPGFDSASMPHEPQLEPWLRADAPYTDPWGCVWKTTDDGILGTVVNHPLASWESFDDFHAPDPQHTLGMGAFNWDDQKRNFDETKRNEKIVSGGLEHGHTFLRLLYLCGYEKLILDMHDDSLFLRRLVEMLEEFNMSIVQRYLGFGAELISYPEDLGMQVGPMVTQEHFKKYIKPSYERLMQPARDAGVIVHMHSDGDIRQLLEDLIDGGVEVINLQDLVNGIDWIKSKLAGKICIELDIDRQQVTRFGTPEQVDALIREEVEKLGSKDGGLMMIYGMYPGVPLENAKALMNAMERYAFYYS